jgi:transposase
MRPLGSEQAAPAEQQVTIASFIRDTKREKHFHAPRPAVLAQSQVKRSARVAGFEQVQALHQQGLSIRTIAHCLGMSRASVSTFVQAETFPEQAPRPRQGREGKLDPFVPYIVKRWQEGEYNGTQLYREIQEQGYRGSRPLVALLIADLRRMQPPPEGTKRTWMRKDAREADYPTLEKPTPPPPPKRKRLTPAQVAWLFVCRPEHLTERQQKQLGIVCQAGVEYQQLYALAQEYVTMITQQQAKALEGWLQRAEHSAFPTLARFAKGLRQDCAAVRAALALVWSNGQTEGQVHRLKLMKRLAYGRAGFDLLRLRVLHGSGQKHQQHCV